MTMNGTPTLLRNPKSEHPLPSYYYQPVDDIPAFLNKRPGNDAGYDMYATETVWLLPFQTKTIKANCHAHIPRGHLVWVASRGGHAGRGWLTHTGIVDTGYSGQIGVMQTNLSIFPRRVKKGERLAQLVVIPFSAIHWKRVAELDTFENLVKSESGSNRGNNAYNSSGKF